MQGKNGRYAKEKRSRGKIYIYLLYITEKFKDTKDKETILKASKWTRIKWPYISY